MKSSNEIDKSKEKVGMSFYVKQQLVKGNKRTCYSTAECRYGENIDSKTRVCNAYELSGGTCVSCSGLHNVGCEKE